MRVSLLSLPGTMAQSYNKRGTLAPSLDCQAPNGAKQEGSMRAPLVVPTSRDGPNDIERGAVVEGLQLAPGQVGDTSGGLWGSCVVTRCWRASLLFVYRLLESKNRHGLMVLICLQYKATCFFPKRPCCDVTVGKQHCWKGGSPLKFEIWKHTQEVVSKADSSNNHGLAPNICFRLG